MQNKKRLHRHLLLITQTLEYDFNGDPSYLRTPRAKEHEIYDFIYKESSKKKSAERKGHPGKGF